MLVGGTGQQNQDFESQRAGQARVVEALQWSLPALYELPGLKQEDRKRRVAQGMLAALQGWDGWDGWDGAGWDEMEENRWARGRAKIGGEGTAGGSFVRE
jgi:hypothetical protein